MDIRKFESQARSILHKPPYRECFFSYTYDSRDPDVEYFTLSKNDSGEYCFVYKVWHRNIDFEKHFKTPTDTAFNEKEHVPAITVKEIKLSNEQFGEFTSIVNSIRITPPLDDFNKILDGDQHVLEFGNVGVASIVIVWGSELPENFVNVSSIIEHINRMKISVLLL